MNNVITINAFDQKCLSLNVRVLIDKTLNRFYDGFTNKVSHILQESYCSKDLARILENELRMEWQSFLYPRHKPQYLS